MSKVYIEGDMYVGRNGEVYVYPVRGTVRKIEKYEVYFLAARGVAKWQLEQLLRLFK